MQIAKGKRSSRVNVRFDTPEERWSFGESLPWFRSFESCRWHNDISAGVASLGLLRPYSEDEFPQTVAIPTRHLDPAEQNLTRRLEIPNDTMPDVTRNVLAAIGNYRDSQPA